MEATPIQLPPKQIEALANGATALLVTIEEKPPHDDMYLDAYNHGNNYYWWTKDHRQNLSVCITAPLQVGDEYYVQEDSYETKDGIIIYKHGLDAQYLISSSFTEVPDSEMTYKQSRFKFDVVSVEVKRVQELNPCEIQSINESLISKKMFRFWIDEQYGQGTYESNKKDNNMKQAINDAHSRIDELLDMDYSTFHEVHQTVQELYDSLGAKVLELETANTDLHLEAIKLEAELATYKDNVVAEFRLNDVKSTVLDLKSPYVNGELKCISNTVRFGASYKATIQEIKE